MVLEKSGNVDRLDESIEAVRACLGVDEYLVVILWSVTHAERMLQPASNPFRSSSSSATASQRDNLIDKQQAHLPYPGR